MYNEYILILIIREKIIFQTFVTLHHYPWVFFLLLSQFMDSNGPSLLSLSGRPAPGHFWWWEGGCGARQWGDWVSLSLLSGMQVFSPGSLSPVQILPSDPGGWLGLCSLPLSLPGNPLHAQNWMTVASMFLWSICSAFDARQVQCCEWGQRDWVFSTYLPGPHDRGRKPTGRMQPWDKGNPTNVCSSATPASLSTAHSRGWHSLTPSPPEKQVPLPDPFVSCIPKFLKFSWELIRFFPLQNAKGTGGLWYHSGKRSSGLSFQASLPSWKSWLEVLRSFLWS